MRKTTYILLITIIGSLIIIATSGRGQEISTSDHDIIITTNDNSISVVENLTIDTGSSDTILIWIQSGHSDISVIIEDTVITLSPSANTYSINLTELDLTSASYIEVRYSLDKDTSEFEKILQYNTTLISITFDGTEIYTGSSLTSGSSLNVALQKATQGQTITEIETIPTWFYIIIIVLIVLLLASFMRPAKKQKSPKIREAAVASEELLTTKKALLMSLLKDIEKQHRSKKISDDTYHKLRGQYKQQAVETMKKLEDTKSKIK